jgi:integrase/recombinase XerD
MIRVRFRYVIEDVDRHGNVRLYYRRRGEPKVRLPGLPGTDEFMAAYQEALNRTSPLKTFQRRLNVGTFGYVTRQYFISQTFKALDKSTRNWRRRALDEIVVEHGDKPVAKMQAKHVRQLRDQKADRPGASRNRLKALRALFRWAMENDQAPHDPTRDIKPIRHATEGHHTWTLEDITAYEDRHSLGSKARLAMVLLLYTACRREDVVRFGPQHVRNNRLQYRQAKNEHRNPIDLDIPVHPDLARVIEATPTRHLTFLVTEYGKPFSVAGFGAKFREWCNQAGLPHCSAHGLRKATAARLAERGATPHEIMAITGHRSLGEVERYTRAARKSQLADSAMAKLKG